MTSLIPSPSVSLVNGRPSVTSQQIAEHFGKRHDSILRDIRRVMAECPKDFTDHNFVASEYTDETGRKLLMFLIYRDGFMLLVMGYTGKKALQIKLAYIAAFNAMEAEIAGQKALPETTTPSTPADRKPLRSLVNAWAKIANVHHSALWPQVRAHFQLERIDDLPVEWIPQSLAFVQGKIDEFQRLQQKALPEAPRRMESNVVLANTPKWYQMQLKQLWKDLNDAHECRRRLLAINAETRRVTGPLYKDVMNKLTRGNRYENGSAIVCLDRPLSNLHSFEYEAGKMIEDGYYMIFDAIGLGLQYAKMLEL